MQIHYNNFDEYKTSYFNIYSDGSVENRDSCTIGNLLEDDIFDILKLKKDELIHHDMRRMI